MWKKILVTLSLIFLTGCFPREKADIPQEGEIVTWKQNDHLVVKAKLGPRHIHIPDTHCKRCEAEFYQPEHEHYLGQFPIDYVPEKFAKISAVEAESLPFPYSNGQLEFDLMLNGSTVKATDESIYSEKSLDHPDQIKVMIFNEMIENDTAQSYAKFLKSNDDIYNKEMSEKYNLSCYLNKEIDYWCFGKPSNSKSTGLALVFMNNNKVLVRSREHIYGGLNVEWIIDQRNLKYWKKIDAAIWNLLDAWNVSPISDSGQ